MHTSNIYINYITLLVHLLLFLNFSVAKILFFMEISNFSFRSLPLPKNCLTITTTSIIQTVCILLLVCVSSVPCRTKLIRFVLHHHRNIHSYANNVNICATPYTLFSSVQNLRTALFSLMAPLIKRFF